MSMVASRQGDIPIISTWATSPDCTIPSDLTLSVLTAKPIHTLGYTRVALITKAGNWYWFEGLVYLPNYRG